MSIPMMPVISPPVRNEIHFGNALAKSFAGDTTLAAMLTASVATTTVNIEIAITSGCENWPTSFTGSQMSSCFICGKTMTTADVITMLIAANNVIVVGNATV